MKLYEILNEAKSNNKTFFISYPPYLKDKAQYKINENGNMLMVNNDGSWKPVNINSIEFLTEYEFDFIKQKKSGYINIYPGNNSSFLIYSSKEEATKKNTINRVDCIYIEWFE